MERNFEPTEGTALAVSAFVRPTLLLEPADSKLRTLESLADRGIVDDLTVQAWPGKVPMSDDGAGSDALAVFDQCTTWADDHDVSVCPPFSVQASTSRLWEDSREFLRTPIFCLQITVDGRLSGVFPHSDGAIEHSVTEVIAALKTGQLRFDQSATEITSAKSDTACPECDGTLVSVQGVRLCHDCAWNDWEETTSGIGVISGETLRLTVSP